MELNFWRYRWVWGIFSLRREERRREGAAPPLSTARAQTATSRASEPTQVEKTFAWFRYFFVKGLSPTRYLQKMFIKLARV
jgi:hypothetical protein